MINIITYRNTNNKIQDWCTPTKYIKLINEFFNNNIELDPCSNEQSIVKSKVKYKLPKNDGLKETWNYKTIYVNPPYGRDKTRKTTIKDWIERCYKANVNYNSEVLALIPVATNTSHWKKYIFNKAKAVCFLADTRLKFRINNSENNKGSPVACAMVYWGKDFEKFKNTFNEYGAVVKL